MPFMRSKASECVSFKLEDALELRSESWISDNLINFLLRLDTLGVDSSVHLVDAAIISNAVLELKRQTVDDLDPGAMCIPVTDRTESLLVPFNSTGEHWVVLPVFVQDSQGIIRCYDPMNGVHTITLNDARQYMPTIMRLIVRQPSFPEPLKRASWSSDSVQLMPGPLMSTITACDCGLVTMDIAAHLAKGLALPAAKITDAERQVYGEDLRKMYAKMLHDKLVQNEDPMPRL